jgi:hypothetical protein
MNKEEQYERGRRISFMTEGYHDLVTKIYDNLIDKQYINARINIKSLMRDLREAIKIMEDDDF